MTVTVKQITQVAYLVRIADAEPPEQRAMLLEKRLDHVVHEGGREIVVDLGEALGIDLATLETLLSIAEELDRHGGELLVAWKDRGSDTYTLSRVKHDDLPGLQRRVSVS
jgi:hypothetical protein